MRETLQAQQITIECPNTIFHLYIRTENLIDIYQWCNRQKILYDTAFRYRRDSSVWRNLRAYMHYSSQKMKYMVRFGTV